MVSGEQICRCNCGNVEKYGIKSYVFGGEYDLSFKSTPSVQQNSTAGDANTCTDAKRIYRFSVELIVFLIFFVFMTAFVIF